MQRSTTNASRGMIQGKGGAAEILDINPSTLRSRTEKLGIKKPGWNVAAHSRHKVRKEIFMERGFSNPR
jgi:hypothetical protein